VTPVIDRDLDVPVYVQLADIIRSQIASGQLQPRRPIPSVRTLVEQYGIARQTASKSIQILADEGLVHMVRGRGWFVVAKLRERFEYTGSASFHHSPTPVSVDRHRGMSMAQLVGSCLGAKTGVVHDRCHATAQHV
jgi:GntR family transcriptional regulator